MTLSEALAPLYTAYLRRLDEMAARIPPAALLTEAVTRGDDGRIVEGADGLALRFDVANGETGETFEVHGARPDEPAARELRVARLDVRLGAGNWEELSVACVFDGEPLPEDAKDLADTLRAWAVLAACGAFAGRRPARGTEGADRWSGRLHGLHVELRENELRAVFDLGSCPPAALEVLCDALSGWCEERVPLARLEIGRI